MFARRPLEILNLSGTAQEIAYQLGRRRQKKIEKALDYWKDHLAQVYRGKKEILRRLERAFLEEAKAQAPSFLEEVRLMAQGADVAFRDLFRLNLTELVPFADKCTDLAFSIQSRGKKGILLAHNEDWDPARNDVFILSARLPECHYVTLAFNGYLPGLSSGRNSFGLIHSVNYLRPHDLRRGLPRIFITRHLVTAPTIKECLQFIKSKKRAFGQSIHLAEEGRYVNLELTARQLVVRRPHLPTAHANHYLSPVLRKNTPLPLRNSLQRQERAEILLAEKELGEGAMSGRQARRIARRILSDRKSFPHSIWREADHPEEGSATLATVMVDTLSPEIRIFRRSTGAGHRLQVRRGEPGD